MNCIRDSEQSDRTGIIKQLSKLAAFFEVSRALFAAILILTVVAGLTNTAIVAIITLALTAKIQWAHLFLFFASSIHTFEDTAGRSFIVPKHRFNQREQTLCRRGTRRHHPAAAVIRYFLAWMSATVALDRFVPEKKSEDAVNLVHEKGSRKKNR